MLRTSIHTVRQWMKPTGRNPAPDWAVDLLALKLKIDPPEWLR